MRSWWGKSSSKDAKKKTSKESFIDTFNRKFRSPESKSSIRTGGSRRHSGDTVSEKGSQSRAESRSTSPSKNIARCQSFAESTQAQPLPLPVLPPANVGRTNSGMGDVPKPKSQRISKPSLFLPHLDGDVVASISSECSIESDDPADLHQRSLLASDYEIGSRTAAGSPSSFSIKDQSAVGPVILSESPVPMNLSSNKNASSSPPTRRQLNNQLPNLQVPHNGAFRSAPDSSMSSPSRSPMRASRYEQVTPFTTGKQCPDLHFLGSGPCSSPGSGQTSGHNSMGGDMSGQLFWQPSRGSPECSPNPSPRMTSPGPGSRIHSGAVTPLHPRAGGGHTESQTSWPDETKQQSHRLPLPPLTSSNSSIFSHSNSAATSPSVPRSPGRVENLTSPGSRWKKGKLLGRGTFGHVYVGFNSETGEMCAMKEVTLFSDDAKSKESEKQLGQEITLLSHLRHPNIVQYYGSETKALSVDLVGHISSMYYEIRGNKSLTDIYMNCHIYNIGHKAILVDDKLYIYLEYVSGGSIHKLLQEYGELGESAISSYTQQILSGLAYLHDKNTVHRDIKGANILVDPNGRVKLADFGMAKHITGQTCPLSFKGSPYWMAPEVIRNSKGCSLAVDIWSLGCTVLEMALSKPPWSQYEGVQAMFKIGNSKELPTIPEHLSDEGKDFVRQCLQRNPLHRPTAAQLLDHPFVKSAVLPENSKFGSTPPDPPAGIGHPRSLQLLGLERLAIHSSRVSKFHSSDIYSPRNVSCPVSPIGSPLLHSRSPQYPNGRMSPSPISSPLTTSGSSTPLNGGTGTIPFHLLDQSILSQDIFSNLPKAPTSPRANNPPYWDPDIFRTALSGTNAFRELASNGRDAAGSQFGMTINGKMYHRQSVLADRVSQQLLRDPIKLNPSFDLNPSSPMASHRMYGV